MEDSTNNLYSKMSHEEERAISKSIDFLKHSSFLMKNQSVISQIGQFDSISERLIHIKKIMEISTTSPINRLMEMSAISQINRLSEMSPIFQINRVYDNLDNIRKILTNSGISDISKTYRLYHLTNIKNIREYFLKSADFLENFNVHYETNFLEDDIKQACDETESALIEFTDEDGEKLFGESQKSVKETTSLRDIYLFIKSIAPSEETLKYLGYAFILLNAIYDFAEKMHHPFFNN
ncbi:hypothetical protein A6A19_00815 [Actinobacillus delphinicola]|uniref:hypothetical protein n=1 Tax=Actinobacillus delphinicola TaxID=51161 RepID=UPI002442596C|nr:hypothetical protein [Actinobacillus delphinicola]MDG6896571.1 hypothetical protein [Actinobacillus delphinicola]